MMLHVATLSGVLIAFLAAVSAEATVWNAEDSPVRIAEAYTVSSGDTLTIDAGVDVLFDTYVPFLVEGALRVRGVESDSVRFLPGTVESWAGLRFSRGDSSSLSYFRVSGVDGMGWETEGDTIGNTVEDARVLFEHGVFSGNVSWKGGGLRVRNGTVLLCNSRFIENHAFEGGGGLFVEDGSLVVMDSCDIMQNTVHEVVGGIAVMSNASLTVTDSRIIGNDGTWGSGALGVVDATADLNRCILAFNINSRYGCGPGDPCIASSGGAVGVHHDELSSIPAASATLTNCTVYGNQAHEGGSVYAVVTGSRIDIENSILWNNASPAAARGGGIIDIRYSNVEGEAPAGEGNISTDPLFRDAANGDFRLYAGSPCIDAGDPSMTGPDGSRIDMGAVQFEEGTTIRTTSAPQRATLNNPAPNPFNPSTMFRFTLPQDGSVEIAVYDVNGRFVRTLIADHLFAGEHSVTWNGTDASGRNAGSGVYFIRMTTPGQTLNTRVTLVR